MYNRKEISDFELGYLVSFLEGEGYIAFNKGKRANPNQVYYTVHIGFVNTNLEILRYIHRIIGIGKISLKPKLETKHKQCYQLRISNQKDTLWLLRLVEPYLIEKREKCLLLIPYLKSRIESEPNTKANHKRRYTDYELSFYDKYKELTSFISTEKRNAI